jgi:hypothetical protein
MWIVVDLATEGVKGTASARDMHRGAEQSV